MSSHVATFWVLSLAFWIKMFGDWHHWLLSPCCYTCMWAVPSCNRQNLGAIPSHSDARMHLDDLLHSDGKASPLLSDWGLSYNHSQCTHGRLEELDIPKIEMGDCCSYHKPLVDSAQHCSKYRYPTHLWSIFLAGWLIFMHLELFLPLALSFMTTSQRWLVWWRNTRKTSASSTWTRTWDVFCDALAARFTNTSQVLVCGGDTDVFILLFHYVHRLCGVIMEFNVSGRNTWKCINISELARKIGPRVSEISLFAVLWFRIDQRLLISTVVPRHVKFWFQACQVLVTFHAYTGCDYTIAFSQNGENRLSSWWWVKRISRCFYTSTWDGIATRFCPLQIENCTCMLYSREGRRVNDAHLQTLLSKIQKRPKMSQQVKKFVLASLPPL